MARHPPCPAAVAGGCWGCRRPGGHCSVGWAKNIMYTPLTGYTDAASAGVVDGGASGRGRIRPARPRVGVSLQRAALIGS
eukprot:8883379-Pyramimonas_sp.AAC.1